MQTKHGRRLRRGTRIDEEPFSRRTSVAGFTGVGAQQEALTPECVCVCVLPEVD